MRILGNFVRDSQFEPADISRLRGKLFLEEGKHRTNLERFGVLLFLSVIIATYGVIGDSTATVIGAMIIAPLMTPIMATAAGLVAGDMKRTCHSLLIVAAGVAGAILTAAVVGAFMTTSVISFTLNSQIVGRVSPNLTDLGVALASGAAGAFAVSRSDVADSLPGVAISIALVPPLAVVGLGVAEGEWAAAWGALLLFLTNFLSILLAGGGTFALLGLSAASTHNLVGAARRRAFAFIALGALILVIPLASTSFRVARESRVAIRARGWVQVWLGETGFELTKIKVRGSELVIVIHGDGVLPPLADLGATLRASIDPGIELELVVVPSQKLKFR